MYNINDINVYLMFYDILQYPSISYNYYIIIL